MEYTNNKTERNAAMPPPLPGQQERDEMNKREAEERERRAAQDAEARDSNPDAITGAPGSHPVGTGIGAATAGAAGAVVGSVVPGVGTAIGAAVGAVVGAVAGGYIGKGVAETINPTAEEAYWRENIHTRPYYRSDYDYENDYAPALWYGYNVRAANTERSTDEYEEEMLRQGWEKARQKSRLTYDEARAPMEDAWTRWDEQQRSRGQGNNPTPPAP